MNDSQLQRQANEFLKNRLLPEIHEAAKRLATTRQAAAETQSKLTAARERISELQRDIIRLEDEFEKSVVDGTEINNISARITDNRNLIERLKESIEKLTLKAGNQESFAENAKQVLNAKGTALVEQFAHEVAAERFEQIKALAADIYVDWDLVAHTLRQQAEFEFPRGTIPATPLVEIWTLFSKFKNLEPIDSRPESEETPEAIENFQSGE